MAAYATTVARRRLGNRLKLARTAANVTVVQAASELGVTQPTVSRIERGQLGVRPRDLEALLDLYGLKGDDRDELLNLARDPSEKGWWTRYASILSPGYYAYISFESEADEIWTWEPLRVPGYWQTDAYYRGLLEGAGGSVVPAQRADAFAEVRGERQRQLAKSQPRMHAVLDESVLHRVVGSREVMAGQLQRLVDVASGPLVTIQIVPYGQGATVATFGAGITVFSFSDGLRVAWTESPANETSIEDEKLDLCIVIYDRLRSVALPADASLRLLREALERSA